jgi:hypothetical protein
MKELSQLMAESLQDGGDVIFTITGCSMAPLLYHRRDKVCLMPPPENNFLKKYDIPLFVRQDGKYILHRIVAVKSEGYVIRGDNQWDKEYPVLPSQIIGVVKGFWRNGKYFDCDNFWYLVYCRLLLFIYFARRVYSKLKQLKAKTRLFFGDKEDEG